MASLFAVDLQSRWPDNQSGRVVSYPVVHRSMLDHACLLVAGGGGGRGGCTQRRVAWTRLRRIEDAKENQLAGQTVSTVRLFARARERDSSNVFRISEHGMYVYKPGTPPPPCVFTWHARARPPLLYVCNRRHSHGHRHPCNPARISANMYIRERENSKFYGRLKYS